MRGSFLFFGIGMSVCSLVGTPSSGWTSRKQKSDMNNEQQQHNNNKNPTSTYVSILLCWWWCCLNYTGKFSGRSNGISSTSMGYACAWRRRARSLVGCVSLLRRTRYLTTANGEDRGIFDADIHILLCECTSEEYVPRRVV